MEKWSLLHIGNNSSHDCRFSAGTMKDRRLWTASLELLKKCLQFYIQGKHTLERKSKTLQAKLRIVTSRPELKEMLTKVFRLKENDITRKLGTSRVKKE